MGGPTANGLPRASRFRPGRAKPAGSCSPFCTLPRHRLRAFHPPLALLVGSIAPPCFPRAELVSSHQPELCCRFSFSLLSCKSEILPPTLVRSSHTPSRLSISVSQRTLPFFIVVGLRRLPLLLRVGWSRAPPLAAVVRPRRPLSGASPAAAVPLRVFPKPRSRAFRSADPQPPERPTASRSPWSARAVPRTAPVPGAPSEVAVGHRGPWSCAPCAHVPGPPVLEARSPRGSGPARPLPWKVLESLGP